MTRFLSFIALLALVVGAAMFPAAASADLLRGRDHLRVHGLRGTGGNAGTVPRREAAGRASPPSDRRPRQLHRGPGRRHRDRRGALHDPRLRAERSADRHLLARQPEERPDSSWSRGSSRPWDGTSRNSSTRIAKLKSHESHPEIRFDAGNFSAELQGKDCGEPGISLILVDAPPGRGPALHVHDYAEVMIVLEGTATFTAGEESREVGPARW